MADNPDREAWLKWIEQEPVRRLSDEDRARLATMTQEELWALTESILAEAKPLPPDHPRHRWSGLIEQQALFHGLRKPSKR